MRYLKKLMNIGSIHHTLVCQLHPLSGQYDRLKEMNTTEHLDHTTLHKASGSEGTLRVTSL